MATSLGRRRLFQTKSVPSRKPTWVNCSRALMRVSRTWSYRRTETGVRYANFSNSIVEFTDHPCGNPYET